jgi:regulator of sirC expression with transglutaminase-like and TPR domain
MDKRNSEALLSLLKDPDKDTFEAVAGSLVLSDDIIPVLEGLWRQADDETAVSRLDWLINRARFNKLVKGLMEWRGKIAEILEGAWLVATYQYPDLPFIEVDDAVGNIAKRVWLKLHDDMTPREQVEAINSVLFGKHGMQGDTASIISINNILINNVLRTRKGNHLGLAILYISVAQKLNIPVFGVPMLQAFALAYLNDNELGKNVVFYIDPFNEGRIFNETGAKHFLKEQQIPFDREYILPCSDEVTIQMLIAEMMLLYESKGMEGKAKDMEELLTKLRIKH